MPAEWPSEAQVRVWKTSDSIVERVLGRMADRIMTGEYPAGALLPVTRTIEAYISVPAAINMAARKRLIEMGMVMHTETGYVVCERPPEGRM